VVIGAALVVRATYLVCHRLISSWKGDLQVSLAALELLSGLAKLHSSKPGMLYYWRMLYYHMVKEYFWVTKKKDERKLHVAEIRMLIF
jgi:hypothetical protein